MSSTFFKRIYIKEEQNRLLQQQNWDGSWGKIANKYKTAKENAEISPSACLDRGCYLICISYLNIYFFLLCQISQVPAWNAVIKYMQSYDEITQIQANLRSHRSKRNSKHSKKKIKRKHSKWGAVQDLSLTKKVVREDWLTDRFGGGKVSVYSSWLTAACQTHKPANAHFFLLFQLPFLLSLFLGMFLSCYQFPHYITTLSLCFSLSRTHTHSEIPGPNNVRTDGEGNAIKSDRRRRRRRIEG